MFCFLSSSTSWQSFLYVFTSCVILFFIRLKCLYYLLSFIWLFFCFFGNRFATLLNSNGLRECTSISILRNVSYSSLLWIQCSSVLTPLISLVLHYVRECTGKQSLRLIDTTMHSLYLITRCLSRIWNYLWCDGGSLPLFSVLSSTQSILIYRWHFLSRKLK